MTGTKIQRVSSITFVCHQTCSMNFSTDCINESANTTHIIVKRSNQV